MQSGKNDTDMLCSYGSLLMCKVMKKHQLMFCLLIQDSFLLNSVTLHVSFMLNSRKRSLSLQETKMDNQSQFQILISRWTFVLFTIYLPTHHTMSHPLFFFSHVSFAKLCLQSLLPVIIIFLAVIFKIFFMKRIIFQL